MNIIELTSLLLDKGTSKVLQLTINTDPGMANVCLYKYALQNNKNT